MFRSSLLFIQKKDFKSWIPNCKVEFHMFQPAEVFPNSQDEFSYTSNQHLKSVKFRFVHHGDVPS